VVAKAHMRATEERERAFEAERAQRAEAAYMSRVQGAAQQADPPQWFGRRKVDWFT
jgi:hypothetical protein